MTTELDWATGLRSMEVAAPNRGHEMGIEADHMLLLGELRGYMKEGLRQRTADGLKLDALSQQVTELSTGFGAHAHNEEEWREMLEERHKLNEATMAVLHARVSAMEAPPAEPCHGGLAPHIRSKHVVAAGGVGLVSVLFGDNVVECAKQVIEFFSKHWH